MGLAIISVPGVTTSKRTRRTHRVDNPTTGMPRSFDDDDRLRDRGIRHQQSLLIDPYRMTAPTTVICGLFRTMGFNRDATGSGGPKIGRTFCPHLICPIRKTPMLAVW